LEIPNFSVSQFNFFANNNAHVHIHINIKYPLKNSHFKKKYGQFLLQKESHLVQRPNQHIPLSAKMNGRIYCMYSSIYAERHLSAEVIKSVPLAIAELRG